MARGNHKCHICGDTFDFGARYYAILTGICSEGNKSHDNVIHFHPTCFEEVAGDEYVAELSGPPVEERKPILKCGDCGVVASKSTDNFLHCDRWWSR